uniref:Transmembrane protein 138 n=1 Tax=Syphacia muris TaxID=451379 RepID=A0A0N5AIR7_9BILA
MGGKYFLLLLLQLALLVIDLTVTSFATLYIRQYTVLLMTFILQDTSIITCIVVLSISLSSTYVFQAGLILTPTKKFLPTIAFSILYLVTTIALQWIIMVNILVLNNLESVFFCFFYKRTALLLSDPKYYMNSEWFHEL